jgi:energy-coupling factor transporter ATP-binding protein EcfA2
MPSKNSKSKTRRKPATREPSGKKGTSEPLGPLTSISIEGFRGVKKLKIDGLAPITVFTGDNGAGKSTLLEAVFAIYGRTNPVWAVQLQARRGMHGFDPTKGPSYVGLFYGFSETGNATLSGRTQHKTSVRLEIERASEASQTFLFESSGPRGEGDGAQFQQSDARNIAEQRAPLVFRAFRDDKRENQSKLVWTPTQQNRFELQAPGASPGRLHGLLQHATGGMLGSDLKTRFGDMREAGRDAGVVELLQSIEPRARDVEYLQTTGKEYFRVKLEDGSWLPLGMLGGGAANAFNCGVNLAYVEKGLLAIDEVDNGIYYRRLPGFFQALFRAREHFGAQLMLATHSFEALSAIVNAATEHNPDQLAVVHLRRDGDDAVHATVIPGVDAKSSIDHGYDLR